MKGIPMPRGQTLFSFPNRQRSAPGTGLRLIALLLGLLLCTTGCAAGDISPTANHEKELTGFLPVRDVPDSAALNRAPPAGTSAAFAADEEAYRATRKLRGTPRWDLARTDGDLRTAGAPHAFSCAIDAPITAEATPRLFNLMARARIDASRTVSRAKDQYPRTRPFIFYGDSTCAPADQIYLRRNGSYPSSHAAAGWMWALILAEIVPDRAERIFERGIAFGESRMICGVHWQSDVNAGFILGAAVTARLHGDPDFLKELAAAREEISAARAKGLKPSRDCKAEAAALRPPEPRIDR
ncbi:MAG TPA: phosphatase PAP2 family protein [Syntrophorhabdaceae bacterium]